MSAPLRIAHVAPVATTIPPPKSGSVETMTSLLTEGLVARGHDVTLFATGRLDDDGAAARDLPARLLARRAHVAVGAVRDAEPRRRRRARRASSTSSTTRPRTTRCRWPSRGCRRRRSCRRCTTRRAPPRSRCGRAIRKRRSSPISQRAGAPARRPQRRRHGAARHRHRRASRSASSPTTTCCSSAASPKARACCRRSRSPSASACGCMLAAAEDDYYREHVAPHVDGTQIVYVGEADYAAKVKLYGGARALLYPVQAREPFGLVLAEAMACGTPVAALDRGAVREVVDDGVTGIVFDDLDADGRRAAARARARSPPRARARGRALRRRAHGRRVRRRLPRGSWRRTVARR